MPVECESAPLVPTTENEYEPVAVLPPTDTVRVLVALPPEGGVTDAGLKPQVTPAGRPVQDRPVDALKPFWLVTVTVLVLLVPCAVLSDDGDAEIAKSGVG